MTYAGLLGSAAYVDSEVFGLFPHDLGDGGQRHPPAPGRAEPAGRVLVRGPPRAGAAGGAGGRLGGCQTWTSPSSGSSGSSTTCSHVGHHQRASSVVPHASWRYASPAPPARAPQSASSRSAPASSRPDSVSSYAKRGGRSE